MKDENGNVSLATKLYYGFGSVAYGVKDNGFSYFLLFFYSQVMGLEGALAGAAMLIVMICDAFSDPIVGHVSDNWHSKWGRRHPFMYFSAIPVAISYYFLWNPPSGMSQLALFSYFIVLAVCVRTFITMYEIPSTSLVSEFTDDYDQRTSILSFRYFFGWWGGLTIAVVAYKILFVSTDAYPIGQLNPSAYATYGTVASIVIFAAIMISALGTHRHIPHLKTPPEKAPFNAKRTFRELSETLSNHNFLVLFIAAVVGAMASGLNTSLVIYFTTYFWGLPASDIGTLNYVYFFSAAFALIAAPRFSKSKDKKTIAIRLWLTAVLLMPLPVALRLVGFFPENGDPWVLYILMIHGFVDVTIVIMAWILISSMIADVVEDSQKKTGRRSEGLFFAGQSFARKVVHGFGVLAVGVILSVINFPKEAVPGTVPAETLTNLALIYIPSIIGFYCLSIYFMSKYNISRESHSENLEIIESQLKEQE